MNNILYEIINPIDSLSRFLQLMCQTHIVYDMQIANHYGVIIYGAGKVSRTVVKLARHQFGVFIHAIAVSSEDGNPYYIEDVPVIPISMLKDSSKDMLVVVATSEEKHAEIKQLLCNMGFHYILCVQDKAYKNMEGCAREKDDFSRTAYYAKYMNVYWQIVVGALKDKGTTGVRIREELHREYLSIVHDERIHIGRIVVVLGTKCSLRCKECNNLIPHFKPQYDINKNSIISAVDSLLEKSAVIQIIELIGGEPFLSENLYDVLEHIVGQEKIRQVEITTNGSVIPNESLIDLLQNEKVKVRISDYGNLVDKTRTINFFKGHNICCTVLGPGPWISSGGIEKRGRSLLELQRYYERCGAGYSCKTIFGGNLYQCARAASLHALSYMKEEDLLSLDENVSAEKIRAFMFQNYSFACDYCDQTCIPPKFLPPAEQLST